MLIFIVWLGRTFTRTVASRINHETVPLVRVFINMCQMLVILNGLPFYSGVGTESRSDITEILDYKTSFIMPFPALADSTCLGTDNDVLLNRKENFEYGVAVLAGLPFGLLFISALILGPMGICGK